MKRIVLIAIMAFLSYHIGAQDTPGNIKRYDFKDVGKYDAMTYTVLVIKDCNTNEKTYNLRISYAENILTFSDGIAANILNTFNYLTSTTFEPELKGENSYIVCEVSEGLYFKFKPSAKHLDLIWNNTLIAGINRDEIKEFESLLKKVESTFAEKGRDLKDAVIDSNVKKPLF